MPDAELITPTRARRLALRAQGLDGSFRPGRGARGAAATIERLGYVQIDTIAVVERAHEQVLYTRQPSYRPSHLHRLLAVERRVFEYWTHAASYVPMTDYRYYVSRMRAGGSRAWSILRGNRKLVAAVLERIRAEGPLTAADFEDPTHRGGPWWGWKPAKRALEALFDHGELMVTERRNFQRVYDLAERVLPADVDTEPPPTAEHDLWAARRCLDNHGIAGPRELQVWMGRNVARQAAALATLQEAGEIVPLRIRGEDGLLAGERGRLFARRADLVATRRARQPRLHILSPFDNLVIRRPWLERLFGFDYTIECYVPAPKRKHGYFVLPVLWGDRFVARLDAKAERAAGVLAARRLAFEPGVELDDQLLAALARGLQAFAGFNGCQAVHLDAVRPARERRRLRAALADL